MHCLKIISLKPKFVAETVIPSVPHWEDWKQSYHKMSRMCNCVAAVEGFVAEGFGDGKVAVVAWGFDNMEDVKKFLKMCNEAEAVMKEAHEYEQTKIDAPETKVIA